MKELLKDIWIGFISASLVVITRCLDLYLFTGITEIIWLVCGYMVCWIWNMGEE